MKSAALGRRRRDDLADAAFRAAREQRHDVLAHPRAADLGGYTVGVLGGCELEDEDEVRVVDPNDLRGCRACVDDARRKVAERLRRLLGERVAQVQMVDDDRHAADPTAGRDREEAARSRSARTSCRMAVSVRLRLCGRGKTDTRDAEAAAQAVLRPPARGSFRRVRPRSSTTTSALQ
jgi:hypothetical protein